MYRQSTVRSIAICAAIAMALASGGCRKSQKSTSVAASQSQSARPASQPLTITGCLKAGEAPDTFVLTAARTGGSGDTATYELIAPADVNLKDHVGHRLEVNGTVNTQQETASSTTAVPNQRSRPTGTSGSPKVETKTEIDIKRVSVTAVKPISDKCEP
jgi:hypothetical protein